MIINFYAKFSIFMTLDELSAQALNYCKVMIHSIVLKFQYAQLVLSYNFNLPCNMNMRRLLAT